MVKKNQNSVTYKREGNKIEISGDADKVKSHIWFDQWTSFIRSLMPMFVSTVILPGVRWVGAGCKWLLSLLSG